MWRGLKLLVTLSAHVLVDHIVSQMLVIDGRISDKTEDHIEKSLQVDKRYEKRYQWVTDLPQSQTF